MVERYKPRCSRWAEERPRPVVMAVPAPVLAVGTEAKGGEMEKKKGLEVVKEVVSVKQEGESRVLGEKTMNIAVQAQREEKKRPRDPAKLKEMERRLMDIIKICDENLA